MVTLLRQARPGNMPDRMAQSDHNLSSVELIISTAERLISGDSGVKYQRCLEQRPNSVLFLPGIALGHRRIMLLGEFLRGRRLTK